MQTAWRERNPEVRIKSARSALDLNPECASAYILLAEEECTSIIEVEKTLKIALKHAENNYRKSQVTQHQSSTMEALHSECLLQEGASAVTMDYLWHKPPSIISNCRLDYTELRKCEFIYCCFLFIVIKVSCFYSFQEEIQTSSYI